MPYVDNWAVCDSFSPKVFAQHKPELLCAIRRWLGSDQVYTVRYGIGMLMRYYLDDAFHRFLNGLVVRPHVQPLFSQPRQCPVGCFASAVAKYHARIILT